MWGKHPLGEITNNTVEGANNRLKIEGLKDLPPLDWLNTFVDMERKYWTRELNDCLAWMAKMVGILRTQISICACMEVGVCVCVYIYIHMYLHFLPSFL